MLDKHGFEVAEVDAGLVPQHERGAAQSTPRMK